MRSTTSSSLRCHVRGGRSARERPIRLGGRRDFGGHGAGIVDTAGGQRERSDGCQLGIGITGRNAHLLEERHVLWTRGPRISGRTIRAIGPRRSLRAWRSLRPWQALRADRSLWSHRAKLTLDSLDSLDSWNPLHALNPLVALRPGRAHVSSCSVETDRALKPTWPRRSRQSLRSRLLRLARDRVRLLVRPPGEHQRTLGLPGGALAQLQRTRDALACLRSAVHDGLRDPGTGHREHQRNTRHDHGPGRPARSEPPQSPLPLGDATKRSSNLGMGPHQEKSPPLPRNQKCTAAAGGDGVQQRLGRRASGSASESGFQLARRPTRS